MTKLTKDIISQAVADQKDWSVKSLQALTQIPTTLGNEKPGQECMAGLYNDIGFQPIFLTVDETKIKNLPGFSPVDWSYTDRPNLVGTQDGGQNAALIFNGHIDVVSPEPSRMWDGDAYSGVVKDIDGTQWMYGRGAGDMKGGTMCALWALKALHEMGLQPDKPVHLHSPIEEECTGNGALAILADGYTGRECVIPEPFNETLLTAQVGVMWFQVRISGKTTHVLGAGRGVNAIEKSWVIIQALRDLEDQINQPENIPDLYKHIDHPINLNVGIINGGDWASTVAGECVTRFRLGLFPGQKLDDLKAKIEKAVKTAAQNDPWLKEFPPQIEYIGFQAEGCTFDASSALGQSISRIHQDWRGQPAEELIARCTTDVRFYELYHNIPATCYGPRAENIHGVDERVDLNSMQRVAEVFMQLIEDRCGLVKRTA